MKRIASPIQFPWSTCRKGEQLECMMRSLWRCHKSPMLKVAHWKVIVSSCRNCSILIVFHCTVNTLDVWKTAFVNCCRTKEKEAIDRRWLSERDYVPDVGIVGVSNVPVTCKRDFIALKKKFANVLVVCGKCNCIAAWNYTTSENIAEAVMSWQLHVLALTTSKVSSMWVITENCGHEVPLLYWEHFYALHSVQFEIQQLVKWVIIEKGNPLNIIGLAVGKICEELYAGFSVQLFESHHLLASWSLLSRVK